MKINSKTKTLIMITTAFLLSLMTWEFILREVFWRQPSYGIFPKGIVARPVSTSVRSQEGWSKRNHVNEFGTFHPIRTNLPLVVMQGDSYTYAEQVATEENYSSLVRQHFFDKYEILNAGNFGMSVAHYAYNDRYFKPYSPIFHIIQVKYDDFFDSFGATEPVHFKQVGDELTFETYETGFMKWVKDHDGVYNFLNRISVLSYFRDKYLQDINAWVKTLGQKKAGSSVVTAVKNQTSEKKIEVEVITKSLEISNQDREKILSQLKMLQTIYGDKFALLYLPHNPIVKNKDFILEDPKEILYHQVIRNACDELGIPYISMWEPFIDLYKNKKILSSGFDNTIPGVGHINKHGHQLVANEVIKFLESRLGE